MKESKCLFELILDTAVIANYVHVLLGLIKCIGLKKNGSLFLRKLELRQDLGNFSSPIKTNFRES